MVMTPVIDGVQLVCRANRKSKGRERVDFTPVGLTERETFSLIAAVATREAVWMNPTLGADLNALHATSSYMA